MPDPKLQQFASDLHQEVLMRSGTSPTTIGDASHLLREETFTETVLELLDEHDELDAWELCSYEAKSVGSLPAAKLNAWALSGDGATLDLIVTLYHGTAEIEEVSKPETRRQFELVMGFLRRALKGFHTRMEEASDAFSVAMRIWEVRESLATVRLFLLTDGVARSLNIEQEDVPDVEVRYVAWDIEKLSRLRVGDRGVIELNLVADYGGAIPCLETSDGTGEYRTYLAFFPARFLARIYGEHGQRLLERNVRAFLQAKGKINKGLQATLRQAPHRFLAYNNGLCCTAAEVRLDKSRNGGSRLEWIRDFQIVNGGQTTASIFHAMKKEKLELRDVSVQVKLTVLNDPEKVAEIVPMISRFANSQNKVNGADFSANGKFHRDLEVMSRTTWAPATSGLERGSRWYYERARGSYLDDKARQGTPARQKEWARQNPPHQKFTKTDLAKYEHAWLGLPHLVCRGAEKNFAAFAERLEDDGEPAVDRPFFEQVVARVIFWRSAEQLFDSLKVTGYRANSVAYAVAWLAEASARRIDLEHVWRAQCMSEKVSAALLVACSEAHKYLVSRSGNVGEASKRPETWAEFRDMQLPVSEEWRGGLRERSHVVYPPRAQNVEAKAARDAIASVSAEHWFTLSKWAKDRGLMEGWERSLAYSMGRLVARGMPPSDKQAIQAARINQRAQELGFVNGGPTQ
ncbi:MAG: AIPR family protein [Steroidobacteraceae bacterium]